MGLLRRKDLPDPGRPVGFWCAYRVLESHNPNDPQPFALARLMVPEEVVAHRNPRWWRGEGEVVAWFDTREEAEAELLRRRAAQPEAHKEG